MTNIYSAIQLKHLYQEATVRMGIGLEDLVERSAQGFVHLFGQYYRQGEIHLFAGPELNGAIALAVARMLSERRYPIEVYLFYQQGRISEETEQERNKLQELGISINEVSNKFSPPTLRANSLIIDGLWGHELACKLEGGFSALVKWINQQSNEVVSIDLPSGLFADDNAHNHLPSVVRANRTITFETPRLSMFLSEHRERIGSWHVVPLGINSELHEDKVCYHRCINEAMLAPLLSPRKSFSLVSDYGPALLSVGEMASPVTMGYVALAASLVGCSSLWIYSKMSNSLALQLTAPHARLMDANTEMKQVYNPNHLRPYKAIALGLAYDEASLDYDGLHCLFSSYRKPIVLDGYAINLLAESPSLLDYIPEQSILMLDTNSRELLLGVEYSDLSYLEAAQAFSSKHKVTLIIRGTYTTIVRNTGTIYFSLAGNEGMRRDGINELLTGLVLGLIARGYDTLTASLLGVYLWGTAADNYAGRYSSECLSPKALLDEIPSVWKHLES